MYYMRPALGRSYLLPNTAGRRAVIFITKDGRLCGGVQNLRFLKSARCCCFPTRLDVVDFLSARFGCLFVRLDPAEAIQLGRADFNFNLIRNSRLNSQADCTNMSVYPPLYFNSTSESGKKSKRNTVSHQMPVQETGLRIG